MECRLCMLSIFTIIALIVSFVTSEPSKRESGLEEPSSLDDTINDLRDAGYDLRGYSPEIDDVLEKRVPIAGLGSKRYSLMRFGKRGSLMRFGKRGSLMRFGKKSGYDEDGSDVLSLDYPYYAGEYDPYEAAKRGTLMRFGKKSSLMRFGRSAVRDKKPHTPWRFGREEDLYI